MPFKITITVTKPEDSTAPWPFELEDPILNQDNTNLHEDWSSQQPGFIDRSSDWTSPGFVHEKIYIFDTRENCDEFLRKRRTRTIQATKIAYFKEHDFSTNVDITEV